MKKFIKIYKLYFTFILALSGIVFYGYFMIYTVNDPDMLESEKTSGNIQILPEMKYSPVTPVSFSAADTIILPANPGPPNNGLSAGTPGALFNLIGGTRDVYVTKLRTASNATAGATITFEVYIRDGNALGGPVASGPGSSPAGWTLIDTATGVQGPTSSGISEPIALGPILVGAGDTVGVCLRYTVGGVRYFGTGTPPLENYNDTNIRLITGDGRSAPFTPTGSFFSSRALTGEIRYVVSTTTGITNLNTVPEGFMLGQNFPNPFNPSTSFMFAIPEKGNVTIKVFDSRGKEVTELVNGDYSAGTYAVKWDAAGFASGVYFYKITTGNFTQTKKLLLVK